MIEAKESAITNTVKLNGNKTTKGKQQVYRCLFFCIYFNIKHTNQNLTNRHIQLHFYLLCHVGSRFL